MLRAGVMGAENVRRSAERTFDLYALYGISVEGVLDGSVQDACRGDRIAVYRRIRLPETVQKTRGKPANGTD